MPVINTFCRVLLIAGKITVQYWKFLLYQKMEMILGKLKLSEEEWGLILENSVWPQKTSIQQESRKQGYFNLVLHSTQNENWSL